MLAKHLITVVAALVLIASVAAASPQLIDYQGFLKNSGGNPVTGTVNITFTIYTASSGGTSKWSETQNNVSVTGGLFNVTLGAVTAIPDTVFNQNDRWLAVSIGGSELSPRARVSSSAYAMRVNTVDGASGGTIGGDLIAGKGSFGAGNGNSGTYSFVAGYGNTSSGGYSTVSGGYSNTASGSYSTVCGGNYNSASHNYVTIAGGELNSATYTYASVGGGKNDSAYGNYAVVAGGYGNKAGLEYTTVSGGNQNRAVQPGATVSGGYYNHAENSYASVAGGYSNWATGNSSSVPGGNYNAARGNWSMAAGTQAKANHQYAIVIAAPTGGSDSVRSGGVSQITLRADSGIYLTRLGEQAPYTPTRLINTSTGAYLTTGGVWTNASDRNKKENLLPVDGAEILSKLEKLSITRWNYISDIDNVEHIGPMAQDFYATFKLGDDDKTISTIDPAGIALAAIQELYRSQQRIEQKTAEIDDLRAQLAQLKSAVSEVLAKNNSSTGNGDLASTQTSATPRPLNNR